MRIPLKCIDCFSRSIVEITTEDLYFALSYVWGTPCPEISSPRSKDSVKKLQIGIPQVIEDAMTVVKSLGKQYLWVDKYCIDQHNVVAKHYQIQNMDKIYQGTYATIIASAGTDASSGLTGVGCVPSIGKSILCSTLPPLKDVLGETTWITRGWTYQEAALSRRCLFFTELQVYYVCSAMSCSEAIATPL
ncbi:HET-domain-containing protein, partial [Hyaloscypha hepaticicola]